MTDDDYGEAHHVGHELRGVKARLRASAGKGASRGKAGREPVTSVAKVESDRGRKNSRAKGSRAELDVAKMFSEWSGELIRRTPLSGGWSNAKFGVTADLVCPNPAWPWSVEIKHREGWALDDLVTGVRREHDKSIVQWWKQCVRSCPRSKSNGLGKDPLLVFRRNRQPWLVMHLTKLDSVNHFTIDGWAVTVTLLSKFLADEPVPSGLKNHKEDP